MLEGIHRVEQKNVDKVRAEVYLREEFNTDHKKLNGILKFLLSTWKS